MDILQQLKKLEQQMHEREMADDGYYLSRQYKEDCHTLNRLKRALKKD